MTATKSSNPSPPASPRIASYGTAFLVDDPVDTTSFENGIARDVPQFSSPRLDASFLINCGRCLTGAMDRAPSAHVKRVAGTDSSSPKATIIYECSAELRELLAALTPTRADEMAAEWYSLYGPAKIKPAESSGRTQVRLAMIKNLADLAIQGKDRQTMLMLRVEYRLQRY